MLLDFESQMCDVLNLTSFELGNNKKLRHHIHFCPLKGKNKNEEEEISQEKSHEEKEILDKCKDG